MIVHYVGDCSLLQPRRPHGNKIDKEESNSSDRRYDQTSKEVKVSIKNKISNGLTDNQILSEIKDEKFNDSSFVPVNSNVPRNVKQIKNIRYRAKQEIKIFNDDIQNINYLLINGFNSFIKNVSTHPNIELYLADNSVLELANHLLKSNKQKLLTYDTTFKLCNYYVSIICMKNTDLVNDPISPSCFSCTNGSFIRLIFNFGIILS